MKNLINRTKTPLGAVILAAVCLLIVCLVSISGVSLANSKNTTTGGRLITIYDGDSEKTILTQALTIGDALKEAGISTDANDVVEPAIGEELISKNYQVNIYRARPVTIVDGDIRQKIFTAYQTTEQIASAAGITIYPEDEVDFSFVSNLTEGAGLEMTINRAMPVNLTLFGKTTVIRTHSQTVFDMLNEKDINLGDDDRISVGMNDSITSGMNVKIWREGRQTVVVDEEISFDIETIEDADQPVGYRSISTPGEVGQKTVIYEVLIQDDKEISRSEIASVVSKPATKQVEVVGVRGQYNTPTENENVAWEFLIGQGFSRIQTAGIMGNLMQEHRFNTTDTPGGLGIAQWTSGRRARLMAEYPDSYTNIYSQLNFLMEELNGGYAYVRDNIKASNSLVESVQIFQNQFERCGICMESNRVSYAQTILGSH